jgi:hypothetical protein
MTIYAQNITNDEIRITFSSPMSLEGLDTAANYALLPSGVSVDQVLVPSNANIYYVDLYVFGLRLGTSYTLTVNNLKTSGGSLLAPQVVVFTTLNTKSASLLAGLPQMYDTRIKSTLRHLMIAIGMADEEIGG